jgi:hypothetical protein
VLVVSLLSLVAVGFFVLESWFRRIRLWFGVLYSGVLVRRFNGFCGRSLTANLVLRLEMVESTVSFDSGGGLGSDPNWGCLCRL